MKSIAAIIILMLSIQTHTEGFTPPDRDRILTTLKPDHPRLMIDANTIALIKEKIARDTVAAKIYRRVKRDTREILTQKPSEYSIPDGRRLLSTSRRVKERVRQLAFLYLIEGGKSYLYRAWAELEAAAQFKDWNPDHFLDTAEMTYAFAVGYDWLYDHWTEDQRHILRNAIVEKGLKPGLKGYRENAWWARSHNNWNQVCNGGLGMGALAIADEEPELANEILHAGIKGIPLSMNFYAPDGAGIEGVTYWDYGARYNVLFLSSLFSALGTDFDLSATPGFKESGDYQIYISGADRYSFDFADCGLRRMSSPMHFWMGNHYGIKHYSWFRYDTLRQHPRGTVLDLLWFDDSAKDFDPSSLPLDKHFRKADVATLRSSWTDPNALVLGIQAGGNYNLGMHRHLDQGTFILEALGERWAIDSGTERETYQRHRNKRQRWEFYRIRAEGHNTLVFNPANGPDQNPKAECPITTFNAAPNHATAVLDLTDVYADDVTHAQRTFEIIDQNHVVITDDIEAKSPSELWWFMHTRASIKLEGQTALLTRRGKHLKAEILSPSDAIFTVLDATPLPTSPNPKQADNTGRRKLAIHFADVTTLQIKVKLTPEVSP
ncbi:MAG: heparinase II/III family protein [Gemmatimonadota bacterium]|nr:heparinase II/III family protein [Gemmatimonadota bacterium]